MAEYIKLEDAIAIIEEKQKELCPVGRYGRNYVYGSDREKYDSWDEIIDALENIPNADVAPVIHATWVLTTDVGPSELYHCSRCGREEVRFGKSSIYQQYPYCHCGAKMDGGVDHES